MWDGVGGCCPGRTDAVEKGSGRDAAAFGIPSEAAAAAATAAAAVVADEMRYLPLLFEREAGNDWVEGAQHPLAEHLHAMVIFKFNRLILNERVEYCNFLLNAFGMI